MDSKIDVEELDKKMQKNGWNFIGPILNFDKAWKKQASIYEKDGKYVISGIDSSGDEELNEPISKKDALKRIEEGIKEIRKYMFGVSK